MSITDVIMIMLVGLWVFVPAMIPNSAAVVFGGGKPIDFGRTWGGKRILGDGKTWRGFIGGGLSGVALGLIMIGISYFFDPDNFWGFGQFWSCLGILFCLSFGSLIGDMLGSLIKRRMGLARGQKAPILDQFDFVIGAFLITAIFYPHWIYDTYIEGWHIAALIFVLIMTLILHRAVNIVGYKAGLKKEPW